MVFQYLRNQCGIITTLKQENGKEENMADPAKHKSVSVPRAAWSKAQFLKDKIIDGTELSISKVIESIINERAKKHGYKNGKA